MKNDYPFIRAWGRVMGSQRTYIEEQVAQAREDNAPEDAIYWRHEREPDGRTLRILRVWHTYREVTSLTTRSQMAGYLAELGVKEPEPDPTAMRDAAMRDVASLKGQLDAAETRLRAWQREVDHQAVRS